MFPVILCGFAFSFLGWLSIFPFKGLGGLKKNKLIFVLCALSIICFIGFRNRYVGTDTPFYVDYFLFPLQGYRGNQQDLGFQVFNSVVRFFSSNVTFYLFCSACCSLLGLFFLAFKTCKNYFLFFCLFFLFSTSENVFTYYCGMQRQILAMSLCFMGLWFWAYQKNFKLAFLFFILACFFHITSIVCLLLYGLGIKISLTDKQIKLFIVFLPISYILGCSLFSLDFALTYGLKLIGMSDSHYISYLNGDYGDKYNAFSLLINMLSLPLTLIGELMLFYCCKKKPFDKKLVSCLLVGIVFNNLFANNLLWGRLIACSTMLALIVIPNFIEHLQAHKKILAWMLIFCIYFFKSWKFIAWQMSYPLTGNILIPYTFFN